MPLDRHRCCVPASLPGAATRLRLPRRSRRLPRRTPIAQMKPRSSRPTAVTTCCWHLPRAEQVAVARVQPVLRLPGDRLHLLAAASPGASAARRPPPAGADRPTPLRRRCAGGGRCPVLVMPPRRVRAPLESSPRTSAAVAHQLPGRAQSARARRLRRRSSPPRSARCRAAPAAPRSPRASLGGAVCTASSIARSSRAMRVGHVLDFVEVVQQRRLLRRRARSAPCA